MTFTVIDRKTGKKPEQEQIVKKEIWTLRLSLSHCEPNGFAITGSGELILLDECGRYAFCPQGRFEVRWEGKAN